MSTLVLEVKFIDDTQSVDKEFADLTALSVWLHGQRESDFDWLCLHDNNNDYVFEGWSDIYQYIRENTGPIQWPVCDDLAINRVLVPHDLSQCGDACNCMKCNPSKSSCIALSEPEHSMEGSEWVIDPFDAYEPGELPPAPIGTVTFGELEDGAEFYVAMTWAYGSRNKLQKVMEDGEHNAVWCSATHIGELIPDGIRVVRA